ncbi:MAG TPA: hypothetical protein VEA80_06545 [Vitreimonas sp.]|uniref:hypothetical protein n=1 Tax=Vitreimonas sp. TaxID=3069702 RepID=UPI002D6C2D31|nr:hypothetical protein [Vitreimonas sp.]HYD87112.1 hypothetical protein [Vitreimonas sp.]
MTLKVKKAGAQAKAPVTFELGHGAVLTCRVLDAFEHKFAMAEARAELNALIAGDETKHNWLSLEPRREEIRTSQAAQAAAYGWMQAVLLAAAAATALTGVVDEDGVPLDPSFETFELLFNDSGVESAFRLAAWRVEQLWDAEKNVSGPGPNGSGPEAAIGATAAEPPESPAPQADGAKAKTDAAPSSNTPPAPEKANSPGTSPQAPDAGSSPG